MPNPVADVLQEIDAAIEDAQAGQMEHDIIVTLQLAKAEIERLSRERDTGVPEGWQLVPKEPTKEMITFGRQVAVSVSTIYYAMLSDAPQPPTVSTQGWQDKTGEAPRDWVIRKNGYFYRANRSGYTQEIVAAGLYTEAEAKAEARIEGITAHRASEFIADMPDIVSTLTRERDQAREALAFYANQDNWNEDGQCFAGRVPVPMWASDDHGDTFIDGHLDLGATARSVLSGEDHG